LLVWFEVFSFSQNSFSGQPRNQAGAACSLDTRLKSFACFPLFLI
jgi:hypothetical protein